MILGLRTVIYHVADLAKAKAWDNQVLADPRMVDLLAGTIQCNHEWTRMDTNKISPRKAFSEDPCQSPSNDCLRAVA
jgi:hypothetical protein